MGSNPPPIQSAGLEQFSPAAQALSKSSQRVKPKPDLGSKKEFGRRKTSVVFAKIEKIAVNLADEILCFRIGRMVAFF